MGVIVSRAVGKAVVRNRVRRRMKAVGWALAQDVQRLPSRLDARDMFGEKRLVAQILLDQNRGQGRQAPRVRPGAYPQVEVGHLGGVGADRIDDDHRPPRILCDVLQHGPGPRKAL